MPLGEREERDYEKKVLTVVMMMAMTVSLIAGCGGKEKEADFEDAHPDVDIEYENTSVQAIKEKLSVLAAGGDLPDIFFAWGGECLNRFSRAGRTLDLTPYMEDDPEWRDSFLPSFLSSSVYDGKNYAVPYRSSVLYMLYSKQVFADNNLDVPETWDEFIDVCERLKANEVTPIAFGNSDKWYTMWYVGQFNANYVDAGTRTSDYNPESGAFTDPGYTKAVQTFLDLDDKGYLGTNVNSQDYYQVREEFASGDETSSIVTGGSENYAVSAECKHPDEAVAFLKFMTSKEQALKQTKETGLPNALIGGITEDNSDPVIAAAYETAEDYTAIAEWLDQCVDGNVANTYRASLQEGLDGKTAEDIIADVQKAAKEVAEANK